MAYIVTSEGNKYVPDWLRITGKEIIPVTRKGETKPRQDVEMAEIRELEKAGVIPVDEYTYPMVQIERAKDRSRNKGKV